VVCGIFCPVEGLDCTTSFLQQYKCLNHPRQPFRPTLVNNPG
jgi:hypothetical protein